jgi:glycine cleavage system H protein
MFEDKAKWLEWSSVHCTSQRIDAEIAPVGHTICTYARRWNMSIDAFAKYAESHEYAKIEGNNVVVGISDHAQDELGDIVFIELPPKGKVIGKGKVFGTIESVKAASDLYMPISGEILAVNEALLADSGLVNKEPYSAGWMIRVKPSNLSELDSLMSADAYAKAIGEA